MTNDHTALPWRLEQTASDRIMIRGGVQNKPSSVITCDSWTKPGDRRLIVHAANNHYSLVAALERASKALGSMKGQCDEREWREDWQDLPGTLEEIEAALRRAKGESFGIDGELSPVLEYYISMKRANPEPILLIKMGDFYEAFGDDAKTFAETCKIHLTKRNGVPMAGTPYHSTNRYISTLMRAGHRVQVSQGLGAWAAEMTCKPEDLT